MPFSEIPCGETFWWEGKVYVKETEELIFRHEPIKRPFPWREEVEVISSNDQSAQTANPKTTDEH